jgi:hypothetical protein
LRVGDGYASWASSWRLHVGSRAPPASVTESDFPRLTNAVGAMIAAAVAPSAAGMAVVKSQVDFDRKERVRQAVRRHSQTPTLEPKTLSRLVGMSRSNLLAVVRKYGRLSGYSRRIPFYPNPRRCTRSRLLPKTSASQTPPVSVELSNGNSAIAPADCGQMHWRAAPCFQATHRRQRRISARYYAGSSET